MPKVLKTEVDEGVGSKRKEAQPYKLKQRKIGPLLRKDRLLTTNQTSQDNTSDKKMDGDFLMTTQQTSRQKPIWNES